MTSWLRSNWLEVVLAALVAASEAAAVAPWLHLLIQVDTPAPLGAGVVGLVSFWSTRGFLAGGWDLAAARALSFGLWLAVMVGWFGVSSGQAVGAPLGLVDDLLHGDGAALSLLAVGIVAWWRGLALGTIPDPFSAETVRRLALRGMLLLGAALLVAAMAGEPTSDHATTSAAGAIPVLFACGLVAAAVIQVRAASRQARTAGERHAGLGWLGAATGLALGMLLVAVLLAGIASRDIWGHVLGPLATAADALGKLAFWVLVAAAYVLFLLLAPFIWLVRLVAGNNDGQPPNTEAGGPPSFDQLQRDVHQDVPLVVRLVLELGLGALVVGLAVWLVLRTMRRYRAADERPIDEVRESVWSRELALGQLRGLLAGMRPARATRRHTRPFDLKAEPRDVRDAYRHLLVFASRAGHARHNAETPGDYAGRLEATWPMLAEPLDDLTQRYLRARYGDDSSLEDAATARRDWAVIRDHGRGAG